MNRESDSAEPSAGVTQDVRGDYSFGCGISECPQSFHGDDLATIAQSAARHWNRDHGDKISRRYEAIDEKVIGGHHIQGNSYEVRKYKVYLTSFDVMERIGHIDGRIVPSDPERVCSECLRKIPDEEHRIQEDPDDSFNDEWTCAACLREQEIERRKSENEQITEWCA